MYFRSDFFADKFIVRIFTFARMHFSVVSVLIQMNGDSLVNVSFHRIGFFARQKYEISRTSGTSLGK